MDINELIVMEISPDVTVNKKTKTKIRTTNSLIKFNIHEVNMFRKCNEKHSF